MFFFIIHHIFIAVVQHFNKVFVTFLTTQHQETWKHLRSAHNSLHPKEQTIRKLHD